MTALVEHIDLPPLPGRGGSASFSVLASNRRDHYGFSVVVHTDGVVWLKCSCPAARFRGACKHVGLVADIYENRSEIEKVHGGLHDTRPAVAVVPDDSDIWNV